MTATVTLGSSFLAIETIPATICIQNNRKAKNKKAVFYYIINDRHKPETLILVKFLERVECKETF